MRRSKRLNSASFKKVSYKEEGDKTIMDIYNLHDKLECQNFEFKLSKELLGSDLTLDYIKESKFKVPMIIRNSDGLGMVMPDKLRFSVDDVSKLVGRNKKIPVQLCENQTTFNMQLKDYCEYYNSKDRRHTYNVLSLEFSNTKLDNYVKRPKLLDRLDWIDLYFPSKLKDGLGVRYPKIRKYCLMSVSDSFTCFHIDFGGTSVWYHVLKGTKIFWLIEPTKENLQLYENWCKNGCPKSLFLGDVVKKCQRITLTAGNTFLMPSGWIHAVYTPEDSIVFGGNFTHSLAIEMQMQISEMEVRLRLPSTQRFPLEINLQFFFIEEYLFNVTGKSFLDNEYMKVRKRRIQDLSLIETAGMIKLLDHLGKFLTESIVGITDTRKLWQLAINSIGLEEKPSLSLSDSQKRPFMKSNAKEEDVSNKKAKKETN